MIKRRVTTRVLCWKNISHVSHSFIMDSFMENLARLVKMKDPQASLNHTLTRFTCAHNDLLIYSR